jgi:signal transduction histidine kinase
MLEVREISYRLKPRILEDFGLVPSLKALCNEISGKSGINGIFQAHKFDQRLNPELETGLYRITQEALNNMVKYSKAKEFSVQLVRHPDVLMLIVIIFYNTSNPI